MALTAGRVFLLPSLRKTIPRDTLETRVQCPREADAALEPPEKCMARFAGASEAHGHALAQCVRIQRGNPGASGVASGMSLPSPRLSFPCCKMGGGILHQPPSLSIALA